MGHAKRPVRSLVRRAREAPGRAGLCCLMFARLGTLDLPTVGQSAGSQMASVVTYVLTHANGEGRLDGGSSTSRETSVEEM